MRGAELAIAVMMALCADRTIGSYERRRALSASFVSRARAALTMRLLIFFIKAPISYICEVYAPFCFRSNLLNPTYFPWPTGSVVRRTLDIRNA